ncbi:MAG: hypothetical protein ACLFM0_11555, partial [Spirochaetales bacterium]
FVKAGAGRSAPPRVGSPRRNGYSAARRCSIDESSAIEASPSVEERVSRDDFKETIYREIALVMGALSEPARLELLELLC